MVKSDVMSDGQIPKKFAIPTHRPATLGPNIKLPQDQMLAAFRDVLAGNRPKPLKDNDGKTIKATMTIESNGTAKIKVDSAIFAFTYAGLLSSDPKQRLEYLEIYLREHTLAGIHANALRAKVAQSTFSDEDFLSVVETLLTAQESFVQTVKGAVAARELTNSDLLPNDDRHWENLVAPSGDSRMLETFLNAECEAERARLLAADPIRAFRAISLSFCAPALVPIDKFKALPKPSLLEILQIAASLPDHLAQVGAFEICASAFEQDAELEAAGLKLLDRLLEMETLRIRCLSYAGAFVMTSARLAQHSALSQKPAFWRRVTTSAHSSLILRACGFGNADDLYEWAMEHSGKAFLFSVLLEMDREPRWKADWLTGRHLVADAFGRVEAAINKIPEEARPKAWLERLAKGREWITENGVELFAVLPAIGESAPRKMPSDDELYVFRPAYDSFVAEPNATNLLRAAVGFYTVGVTEKALQACHSIVTRLRKDGTRWDDDDTQYVLQVLAFVAIQTKNAGLAESVADFCVEKVRELPVDGSTLDIVCRLVECAGANSDRDQAMEALARRLESLAFLAPPQALNDLHDSLRHLQLLDSRLSSSLGKAVAAARLGRKAA